MSIFTRKTTAVTALLGLLLPLTASHHAHAVPALFLELTTGTATTGVIAGSGGLVSYTTPALGSYSVDVAIGTGYPAQPGDVLDLGAIVTATGGSAQQPMTIKLTETGLTKIYSPLTFLSQITTTPTSGSLVSQTFQTYIDNTNAAFGTGTPLSDLTSPDASATAVAGVHHMFSETEILTINFGKSAGGVSDDGALSVIDEPASLALLGFALTVLGLLRGRRPRA